MDYTNLLDFIADQPEDSSKAEHEEIMRSSVPEDFTKIGTLKDDRLHPTYYSYKLWTHYALGFYPFNDCDIYRDEEERILFSYIEYGGHVPFRRSFLVNKNSPIIHEPVSFNLWIEEQHHQEFLYNMEKWGLSSAIIKNQLQTYKTTSQLTNDLPEDVLLVIKRRDAQNHQICYTMIAPRKQAVELTAQFNDR